MTASDCPDKHRNENILLLSENCFDVDISIDTRRFHRLLSVKATPPPLLQVSVCQHRFGGVKRGDNRVRGGDLLGQLTPSEVSKGHVNKCLSYYH